MNAISRLSFPLRPCIYCLAALCLSLTPIPAARAAVPEPPPLSEAQFSPPLAPAVKWLNQGAFDKSLASLRSVKKSAKVDQAQLHYLIGAVQRRRGDTAGAVTEFRKSLALRGSNSDVLTERGASLAEQGKREEAVEVLREAIWFNKFTRYAPWQLYLRIGALYEEDEKPEKAEEAFKQAQVQGGGPFALLKLAEIQFAKGEKRQAVEMLRAAYKHDNANMEVRQRLSSYLLTNVNRSIDKQDIAEALSLAEGALAGKSEADQYANPIFPVYLRALLASGKIDEAERKLNAAAAAHPENVEYQRLIQQMSFERQAAARSAPKEDTAAAPKPEKDGRAPSD